MLIGGLDIGTTGCKLTVYDDKGNFIHNEYTEYEVTRKNDEHEIDTENIFSSVCTILKKTCNTYENIEAIGITSFGETFAVLDKDDNVIFPSMLYTDPRGTDETKELIDKLGEDKIIHISGTKPHPMYSLPKIMWLKNNKPEPYADAKRILLIEDFIVYMLTGVAQIDYSLAARTLGFDIRNKCWSNEIFDASGIDVSLMSVPVKTGSIAGKIKKEVADKLGIPENIKIASGCHDQIASALGSGVFETGMAADGTGTVECVVPMFDHIPENKQLYDEGYSVVPYVFDNTYVCYALSFTGGAVLKWYRDNFAKYEHKLADESGKNVYAMLDDEISDEPTKILIMPHFAGAANPYMDNSSKAAIIGLTLEHTNYDLYKALMEGVTYEIMTNIEHLESFGIKFDKLIATGGGATSKKWLQIKSDILSRPITTVNAKEVGACGTCMLTAVSVGICRDLDEARNVFVKEKDVFLPNAEIAKTYKKCYNAYKDMYASVRNVVKEL